MNSLQQYVLPGYPSTVPLYHFRRGQSTELLRKLLLDMNPAAVGLSIRLSSEGGIDYIAFATSQEVLLLKVESGDTELSSLAFDGSRFTLAAFDMAQLALHIYQNLKQHVQGVDLSTLKAPSTRRPWQPSKFVQQFFPGIRMTDIDQLWDGDTECGFQEVCIRAWLSASVAERCISEINTALKVDTRNLKPCELDVLGQMTFQTAALRNGRPKEIENEFNSVDKKGNGELLLQNSRFKNRVRPSLKTSIVMTNADGDEFTGRAQCAVGKTTSIQLHGGNLSGTVERVRIIGREELTGSERARDEFILLALQGERSLDIPFICFLWFPSPGNLPKAVAVDGMVNYPSTARLNDSQRGVIRAMLSDQNPLVIAHGPPGTGKTSTISAAVKMWNDANDPVWIVAQSNVAVKNIAESLLQRNVNFKLIVSQEFYVEWHEHIYEKIENHLLRSDELPSDLNAMERTINGSPVILCTLSMLSNPILKDRSLYKLVPVERLVVDEASQIDVGEFMHLFHIFKKLKKVCFFGDPKQLPPYGKDTVQSLQSVFEIKHLRNRAHFLNVQYRMPIPLGTFISEEVYNNKLRSEHRIDDMGCVAFVDVSKGREEKCGNSWRNKDEIHCIVNLVRHYYRHMDFCIITPYDAQRAAIERQLKAEDLPWERVFNVDSFQGNEAEYVILSIVRTTGPGFLVSQNRSNVMLTRCKAGLVIVTNRIFLRTTGAQYTLLGNLAHHWTQRHGESKTWKDWKGIAEHKANMPGAPTPYRSNTSIITNTTAPLAASNPLPSRVISTAINPIPPHASGAHKIKPVVSRINEFPDLGAGGGSKNAIKGRWSDSSGVNAIKHIAATLPSPLVGSTSTPSLTTRTKQQPVTSTCFQDHFPMLENHRAEKLKSRRKNSSI